MTSIAARLITVHNKIIDACRQFERNPEDITLLAVSKKHSITCLQAAIHAGQTVFGENYVKEGVAKIQQLTHYPLTWHYLGQIQTNKTRSIAEHFNWIHTVTSIPMAARLAAQRPSSLSPLQVCIQVNIDQVKTKNGVKPEAISTLATAILQLPRLKLRGLMFLPTLQSEFNAQRQLFAACRALQHQLTQELGISLDTLSMGTSQDFVAAIAEGTTIIRLGTALFGRPTHRAPPSVE